MPKLSRIPKALTVPSALCAVILLFSCTNPIHVQKNVLLSSPLLNSVEVCREGLCILPVWDGRTDTARSFPTTRQIERVIRKAGHRQLRLVSVKKLRESIEAETEKTGLLYEFTKSVFADVPFDAPGPFWDVLGDKFFLRITLRQGDLLKMFDGKRKVQALLEAAVYGAGYRRIVWKGSVLCRGTSEKEMNAKEITDLALDGLAAILPVSPKVGAIKFEDEYW